LSFCAWAGAVGNHFSSVPLGDRRHINSSLGCLMTRAMLVGSFLQAPFVSSSASTPTVPSPSIQWHCQEIYLFLIFHCASLWVSWSLVTNTLVATSRTGVHSYLQILSFVNFF
jgi:hypothetical protein